MKTYSLLMAIMIGAVLFASYVFKNDDSDSIYYISLNRAIHLGQYDGEVTPMKLKIHGNFGLGSEEKLASELVMLDGVVYGIPSDGKARIMSDRTKLPFAAVKFFQADKKIIIKNLGIKSVEAIIDSVLIDNTFSAIKINGRFSSITYRSFIKQERPYKPVDEVEFKKFERNDIKGTIVGFYTPKSAEVLNSPQFHFHFIDEDKTTGGHLLDCALLEANVEIDYANELNVDLASPDLLKNIDLNSTN